MPAQRGRILLNGTVYVANSPYDIIYDNCVDSLGRATDHPLSITHIDKTAFTAIDGVDTILGSYQYQFEKYIPGAILATPVPLTLPSLPSDGEIASYILSRTNPSRPTVSIPNFVYELKDLPGMLRDAGNFLRKRNGRYGRFSVKENANHYLAYQFGWKPLIGDLRKMMQFQTSVDKRMNELKRLYDTGGISKTIQLRQFNSFVVERTTGSYDHPFQAFYALNYRADKTTQRTVWGSVRWELILGPKHLSNSELQRRARNLVFGTNLSPAALWQAMPWSWLIDWFTNVGDLLGSFSNAVPVVPKSVNLMIQTETITGWNRTDTNTEKVSGGHGFVSYTTKERRIISPSLTVNIPFLSGYQLSILSALAIQRAKH